MARRDEGKEVGGEDDFEWVRKLAADTTLVMCPHETLDEIRDRGSKGQNRRVMILAN